MATRSPLARPALGGRRVVFAAPDEHGAPALFAAPSDARGPAVRLGGTPAAPIGPWEVSADGRSVVFAAGGLFRAEFEDDGPARLLSAGGADERVRDFVLAADGTRALYRAAAGDLRFGLYEVALDGAHAPLELVAPNTRGEVLAAALDPRGRFAVFTSLHADGGQARLYRSALDGGAPVELFPGPYHAPARVDDFRLGADGERVLFRTAAESDERLELDTLPLDGPQGPVRLGDPLAPEAGVVSFDLSPDGAWVVYLCQRGAPGRNDLVAARGDASAPPVVLSAALAADGCVTSGFAIDPGSARVVFAADPDGRGRLALFVAALDGGSPPLRLDAALDGPGDPGSVGWYGVEQDGEHALFQRHDGGASSALWRVALASPARRLELGRVTAAGDFRLSPEGTRLVCLEHLEGEGELCSLALDGRAAPVRRPDLRVSDYSLAPDGRWALARAASVPASPADEPRSGGAWLRVPLDGDGPPLALDPRSPTGVPGFADEPSKTDAASTGGAAAFQGGAPGGGRIDAAGDVGFRDFSFGTTGLPTPTARSPSASCGGTTACGGAASTATPRRPTTSGPSTARPRPGTTRAPSSTIAAAPRPTSCGTTWRGSSTSPRTSSRPRGRARPRTSRACSATPTPRPRTATTWTRASPSTSRAATPRP
jgi:hypothetical protein